MFPLQQRPGGKNGFNTGLFESFLSGTGVNFHPMAFTFSVWTLLRRSHLLGDLRRVEKVLKSLWKMRSEMSKNTGRFLCGMENLTENRN